MMRLITYLSGFVCCALLIFSCANNSTRITFDPDFYRGHYEEAQIQNENGITISCHVEQFNEFFCMHRNKVLELAQLILRLNIPDEKKKTVINKMMQMYE